MPAAPEEILEDLDTDECIQIDYPRPMLVWAVDDEQWYALDQTRSGTWAPRPRPIPLDYVEELLEISDSFDVQPHTTIPSGRHPDDD